jgi:hypothetical protein
MRKAYLCIATVGFLLSSSLTFAQDGFFADWFNMVSETQAEQPHWITPLNTTTPRLEQEFRHDIQWQTHNSGVTALTHQNCYLEVSGCLIQNATGVKPMREGENEETDQIDGFSGKVVHRETL